MAMPEIGVGLLGLGTVGSGICTILQSNAAAIAQKVGAGVAVRKILVRDKQKPRAVAVDERLLTEDYAAVLADPSVAIVVEVMGGEHPAKEYILQAIAAGKPVVTANKELIAKHGQEILARAAEQGVEVYFEASVGGGIPVIRPLKRCLAANRITEVMGIINGTTNYILTKMSKDGRDFAEVLREAQQNGYAESDPTADVDGYDASYKILILASAAFNKRVVLGDVYREGIRRIGRTDIAYAKELGYAIKLLGIARDMGDTVDVRVHPALLPLAHPLAAVDDVYNAIWVNGDAVGSIMFYGRGAGSLPTGSAAVGDIMEAARDLNYGVDNRLSCTCFAAAKGAGINSIAGRYYLRLLMQDRAGVLGEITTILGNEGINLSRVLQKNTEHGVAEVVLITDIVSEGSIQAALKRIGGLDNMREVANLVRIVDESTAQQ